MEAKSVGCLINSMSRYIHLVSCQTLKSFPTQNDCLKIVGSLKLLKPLLDEVAVHKISSDETLYKKCEELEVNINEAMELLEGWWSRICRISFLFQSEQLLLNIQKYSLEICCILERSLLSLSPASNLSAVQHCLQELKCLELERTTALIVETARRQGGGYVEPSHRLIKILELLGLTSSQELLKEHVALEKERMNEESDRVDKILDVFSQVRGWVLEIDHLKAMNGVLIPPYFRCPLSMELMMDPVIIASGQTYEKGSIQRWLDHGFTVCPKTRQELPHKSLIPNYTVKALIANWCDEHNVRLPSNVIDIDDPPSLPAREAGPGIVKEGLKVDSSMSKPKPTEKCDQSSQDLAISDYFHPSLSNSSSRSSTDAGGDDDGHISGGATGSGVSSDNMNKREKLSHCVSEKQDRSSRPSAEMATSRSLDLPASRLMPDDSISASHAKKLVEDLTSDSKEARTCAAAELRYLAKFNKGNRTTIGRCGAIPPLMSLLYAGEREIQEHAVTALLNLSIDEENKAVIARAGALEALIHVLKTGNPEAKENSAAALFSLSTLEEYKAKIGSSGAVKGLVDLLRSGSLRGKKDAATALFNLSILHENKARIVQAGAVKHLVAMMGPGTGMVDKAVALLMSLSAISEGQAAISQEEGIPLLVEIVEAGSQTGKENATSILLQMCLNNTKHCALVLREGAIPPLVALTKSGTTRGKEKARQLLDYFRTQREGGNGKKT